MDNIIFVPELNPVIFFDKARVTTPKHLTKFFEDFMFTERLYAWQTNTDYKRIWQTTDIIYLQFESTFDPINVSLIDHYGIKRIELIALIGLPNRFIPNTKSYQVSMSLAGLPTGCYTLEVVAGLGAEKKTLESHSQYISATPLPGTVLMEYFNSTYHKDVVFETGIKFQFRVPANFGFLEKSRKDEGYRDQKYNYDLLSSKSSKQWPIHFGDQFGLPDDIINLIDEIWSCDNVSIDNKPFGAVDGAKMEFTTVERHPLRGVKMMVEAGINRNSRLFSVNTDTSRKLVASVYVDARVFGDTGNQGSSNTVPVFNVYE